jgi:1-acyl-sn-glycerol-3-phosphate acyltransferase
MFDIVLLFSYFPDIHTLVNAKFLNNPLLWPIIRACGYVSLRTESAGDGYRAFDALAEILRSGGQLVLFPEGTRSSDGRLGPLKNGPFRLAADFQIPITPLLFTCNQPFLNRQAFFPREPGCVRLNAYIKPALRPTSGQPIEAKEARQDFIRAYEDFIRSDQVLAWNRAPQKEGNFA